MSRIFNGSRDKLVVEIGRIQILNKAKIRVTYIFFLPIKLQILRNDLYEVSLVNSCIIYTYF